MKKLAGLLLITMYLCMTVNVSSDTPVQGEITSDTVWGLSFPDPAGIYIVTDDITVRNNATLTIEAGVEIRFSQYKSLYIGGVSTGDHGRLLAQGTAGQEILFTADNGASYPGMYLGSEALDSSELSYCILEEAGYGAYHSLHIIGCAPLLDHCEIRDGSGYGIEIKDGASPDIISCHIHGHSVNGIDMKNTSSAYIEDTMVTGNNLSGIALSDSSVEIVNCEISQNYYGIYMYTVSSSSSMVTGTTFYQNNDYPVLAPADQIHGIRGNIFDQNGKQQICVKGATVVDDAEWENPGIPYVIDGIVNVKGESGPDEITTLRLSPGTTLAFEPDSYLYVGSSFDPEKSGILNATGTAGSPITFTSNSAPQAPGDWRGIFLVQIKEHTPSRLIHCIVEYGGYSNHPSIKCDGSSPIIKNTIARHSGNDAIFISGSPTIIDSSFLTNSRYGIYCESGSPYIFQSIINGNTDDGILVTGLANPNIVDCQITANGNHGVHMDMHYPDPAIRDCLITNNNNFPISCYAGDLTDIHDNTYTGNLYQKIEVNADTISGDTVWRDAGIPYLINGDVTIEGVDAVPAVLTIHAGVEMQFDRYYELVVGSSSLLAPGGLMVHGTPGNPVLFTQNDEYTLNPGEWKGISFLEFARADQCIIRHAVIEYAGYGAADAVLCQGSSPAFQHCTIRLNDGNGIHCTAGACPSVSGCVIENNTNFGIHSSGAGTDPWISGSSLNFQTYGIVADSEAEPIIGGDEGQGNNFYANSGMAVRNTTASTCLYALYNWWGDAGGPDDDQFFADDCMDDGNDNESGEGVSDDVDYRNWALMPVDSPTPLPTYTPTLTPTLTPTPEPSSTMTDTPTPFDTPTPEPTTTCTPYEISSDITSDITWGLSSPGCGIYLITADVTVRNYATLSIDAGVTIYFEADCCLIIGGPDPIDPGSLRAVGTEQLPILFTGTDAVEGFHDGIHFTSKASTTNQMSYCTVEYGENVVIEGCSPGFAYCTFRFGSIAGVKIDAGAAPVLVYCSMVENNGCGVMMGSAACAPVLTDCLFHKNDSYPLYCYAGQMHRFSGNIYSQCDTPLIMVRGDTIDTDTSWKNHGIGYRVEEHVIVQGQDGVDNVTTLTIEAGLTLYMGPMGRFTVGDDADPNLPGALIVDGTQEEPVEITIDSQYPSPAFWYGITFADYADDTLSELNHCLIEYGGRDGIYNIMCNSSSPVLNNCTSRDGDGPGVYCSGDAQPVLTGCILDHNTGCGFESDDSSPELYDCVIYGNGSSGCCIGGNSLPVVSGCRIYANNGYGINVESMLAMPLLIDNVLDYNNNYAVHVFAGHVGQIQGINAYDGNLIDKIYVESEIISEDSTWTENAIPLFISGSLSIRGPIGDPAVLTIEHGVELQFSDFTDLSVGYSAAPEMGGLMVNGLPGSEVLFTCNDELEPAPGTWGGITFTENSEDDFCILHHAIVEYAGTGGSSGVHCHSVSPEFYHCLFKENDGAGMYCSSSASPVIDACTIRNNTIYGLYITDSLTAPQITRSVCTENPGGIHVTGNAMPVVGGSSGYGNCIFGNPNYGVLNETAETCINAQYNWWGDEYGPHDSSFAVDDCLDDGNVNPPGDQVSDDVDYLDWIDTPVSTPTPQCLHHGDVNTDGAITARDAQLAFYIVVGLYSPNYRESCAADCTGDGNITAGDAQAIFAVVMGTGSCVDPL